MHTTMTIKSLVNSSESSSSPVTSPQLFQSRWTAVIVNNRRNVRIYFSRVFKSCSHRDRSKKTFRLWARFRNIVSSNLHRQYLKYNTTVVKWIHTGSFRFAVIIWSCRHNIVCTTGNRLLTQVQNDIFSFKTTTTNLTISTRHNKCMPMRKFVLHDIV